VQIVSEEVEHLGPVSERVLHVRCECVACGYRAIIALANLRRGRTKGCRACNQPTPLYPKWLWRRCAAARGRCLNPRDPGYRNYGGRGIEFRFGTPKEMALWVIDNLGLPEQPDNVQIDRIETNGHYEPGNLRWASPSLNSNNMRTSKYGPRMHAFRLRYPHVRYADATLRRLMWKGLSDEDIEARWHIPSWKPKGKYGIYATPDPEIASLVKGS